MATLEESVTPWGAANTTVSRFLWGIEDDFLLNQLAQLQISVLHIWQCVRSGFNLPAMRFSPWIMLFATSLSRKNHLFPKRKKHGTGYDISSAKNFFLAIKWPWLLKLFANNMLNIVIKRKREFLDFFRFFSKNSNFWRKFKYVIWSIVYPWKANGLTVKMSMISQLIYQVWGALCT